MTLPDNKLDEMLEVSNILTILSQEEELDSRNANYSSRS